MEQMAPIYPLNSTRSGNRVEVDDAFWKVSRVQSGERTHNSRISALFITRDAPAEARGCKVLKQQSSHEGMAFGTYCGTSPLRDSAGTCASPLHPSTLTATHLTPLTLTRSQAWHFDLWPLSLRMGDRRLYCYLYSGNYQFTAIHYGVREGFSDLQVPAETSTDGSRVNRFGLLAPLKARVTIHSISMDC